MQDKQNNKMTLSDIADALSKKRGMSKNDAEKFVTAIFDVINDGLHTEKVVKIKGLGSFKVLNVKERESVNVNTGERVIIGEHGKITFTPDSSLRDLVNKPFSQFETVVINDGVDLNTMESIDDESDNDGNDDGVETETNSNAGVEDKVDTFEIEHNAQILDEPSENEHASESDHDVPESSSSEDNAPVVESVAVDDMDSDDNISESDKEDKSEPTPSQEDRLTPDSTDDASIDSERIENLDDSSKSLSTTETKVVRETMNDDAEITEEEYKPSKKRRYVYIFLAIVFIAGAFFGGYYFGRNHVSQAQKVKLTENNVKSVVKIKPCDTITDVKSAETKDNSQVKDTTHSAKKINTMPKLGKNVFDSEKYDKEYVMVRTGGYRIIGVDRVIKVKKGQTLKSISRQYLGSEMDCYIKALNGTDDIKEGQTLKIPKLELRHKRKK
jgi:nucleoid DNA-binding protein